MNPKKCEQGKKAISIRLTKVNVIKDRFDEPSFQLFANAEQFLVKVAMKQSYTDEISKVINQCEGDIDTLAMPAELS